MLKEFLFSISYYKEIKLLMKRLGIDRTDATDFLYQYYNKGITFEKFFKKFFIGWVPDGEVDGKTNCIYKYSFPSRMREMKLGEKDILWKNLIK